MKQAQMRPIDILMVEDNPGDTDLTLEAFSRNRFGNEIYIAEDGAEAISFLKKEGKFATKPSPDIILLDMNLPKISGRNVLEFVRKEEKLKDIPVFVLVGSKIEEDLHKSYNLCVSGYIRKPADMDKLLAATRTTGHFWLILTKPDGAQGET